MKNKKQIKGFSRYLLAILVAVGIVLFVGFQYRDMARLQNILDETIAFTKLRINRYDAYRSNDQVKSLVRLLDKTSELSRHLAGGFDAAALAAYADNERLTGILVLDENLNVVTKTSQGADGEELWKDLIHKSYVNDIVRYPLKTYTTRTMLGDTIYDFAAVSRQDAPGMVVAYLAKDITGDLYGDLTLDSLFADFPFEMNGIVVIAEDDVVVSSNRTELLGKTIPECREIFHVKYSSDTDNILSLISNQSGWYGRRDATENYTIYMFFPASQVYMTRNIVCGVYLLLAIMIYLLQMLGKSKAEKEALAMQQKRMRTINAIGKAYYSICLVDFATKEVEVVKSHTRETENGLLSMLDKKVFGEYIRQKFTPQFAQAHLDFMDMDTVVERLAGQQYISFVGQTADDKWILTIIVPQRYTEAGKLDAVLIANRDVTEEKTHEIQQDMALRSALATAEHANKAKTAFLNNMSHDIRTPMNAIIGFTALAQTNLDDKEQVQDYLAKISTSGTHLLSLINDILDMSRIESGSVKLEENPVHLPDVLHDLRTMIQGLISAKNHNLYIDTQDVIHEDVIADKLRLNQVLINIVGNAIKYTPAGGDIMVRLIEKPCHIKDYTTYEFSVKDNGIGMSQEFVEHIFDTFSREYTSTVNGIQGTGLGMAITKNIIDMMGGTISVQSEEGKGSEFIVSLNFRLVDAPLTYEPIAELLGARALVVDDDINTCRSVCKMLRTIEMRPDWTTSGREAVLHAQDATELQDEYKVYIIDYLMPDMNGIETVRRIRRVIGEEIPIIVLTAYNWEDFENEAREAGVTAFVGKPLFMSELRSVLTRPVAKEPETIEAEENKPAQYDYSGKRVLLVEDNELNREIATVMLESTGMEIDTAEDGIEAVNIINEAPEDKYDLVLMDIQMPRMDGYTATREIRTLPNNRKANIPIIAMTANAFDEDRQKAFETGMNGHIVKPIDMEAIARALDGIWGR